MLFRSWSLVFLLGYILVGISRWPADRGAAGRWLHFCATLLVLSLAQWLIASAYFMDAVDWQPLLRSAFAACLVYPVIGLLFRPLNRFWLRPENSSLVRGV